jgi:hypothetical protein
MSKGYAREGKGKIIKKKNKQKRQTWPGNQSY